MDEMRSTIEDRFYRSDLPAQLVCLDYRYDVSKKLIEIATVYKTNIYKI